MSRGVSFRFVYETTRWQPGNGANLVGSVQFDFDVVGLGNDAGAQQH